MMKQDFAKAQSRDKKTSEEANGNADGTATPPLQAAGLLVGVGGTEVGRERVIFCGFIWEFGNFGVYLQCF